MAVSLTPRSGGIAARATRYLLSTTAATAVVVWVPTITQTVTMHASVTVTGSATALTLTAAWTDPDAGAATYAYYTNQTLAAPSVNPQVPITLVAQAGQPVTISATAGTANTVRVTAELWTEEV